MREGVKIEFDCDDQFGRLAPPLETAVFSIVQEALNNACRHSQSNKVRVVLLAPDGQIHVEVQDWGIGFDGGAVKENSFGLRGIRERAKMFDGQATIEAAPNRGTRVIVDLPLLPSKGSLGNLPPIEE